jgi:hypothetical protein
MPAPKPPTVSPKPNPSASVSDAKADPSVAVSEGKQQASVEIGEPKSQPKTAVPANDEEEGSGATVRAEPKEPVPLPTLSKGNTDGSDIGKAFQAMFENVGAGILNVGKLINFARKGGTLVNEDSLLRTLIDKIKGNTLKDSVEGAAKDGEAKVEGKEAKASDTPTLQVKSAHPAPKPEPGEHSAKKAPHPEPGGHPSPAVDPKLLNKAKQAFGEYDSLYDSSGPKTEQQHQASASKANTGGILSKFKQFLASKSSADNYKVGNDHQEDPNAAPKNPSHTDSSHKPSAPGRR